MQQTGTPAISVRGLRKGYRDKKTATKWAVDGIDLDILSGEIFAILGPNGAGKTTTVEILEGYRKRDAGEVLVLGRDPEHLGSDNISWRNQIGIVLQSASDIGDLSVREVIHHFAHYYTAPRSPEEVIASVGLSEKADATVRTLSGGQRRRVDVALGIIGSPEILFLDEPTTGFDPQARREFWELIRSLKALGTTIVLTTHYLDEAEALADRVAVIAGGKILEIATPGTLGKRNQAKVRISWAEGGAIRSLETDSPTAEILALHTRFAGEVPELTVTRPSLEDIYLSMIGEK